MKSFFEEYGFVILSAVVVIALIAMVTPVGTAIQNNLTSLVSSFTSFADTAISNAIKAG